jgi:hypothetical protein
MAQITQQAQLQDALKKTVDLERTLNVDWEAEAQWVFVGLV